jgi:hypothetical protein
MKMFYESPKMSISHFETEDVITTSSSGGLTNGGAGDGGSTSVEDLFPGLVKP